MAVPKSVRRSRIFLRYLKRLDLGPNVQIPCRTTQVQKAHKSGPGDPYDNGDFHVARRCVGESTDKHEHLEMLADSVTLQEWGHI